MRVKNDEKLGGVASSDQVRALLIACKVSELPACKRAGISTSTVLRWKRGSCPKQGQLDVLKRAILEVAAEQGTLPDGYEVDLEALRKTVELPAFVQALELKDRVDRLERVVEEKLGVQL